MRAAVVVFPGSNCDRDCKTAIECSTGASVEMIWHAETVLPPGLDLIVLPGGFAHGDYLRCGAMAALSPVMTEVRAAAERGVAVAGICNGFQILCEARMLPGALLQNASCKFVARHVRVTVANSHTAFSGAMREGQELRMPVAHMDGNYFVDNEGLRELEGEGRVVFRYLDNPNGSRNDIAGIINKRGNVLGLMPHPERASEALLGSEDGRLLFESLLS